MEAALLQYAASSVVSSTWFAFRPSCYLPASGVTLACGFMSLVVSVFSSGKWGDDEGPPCAWRADEKAVWWPHG